MRMAARRKEARTIIGDFVGIGPDSSVPCKRKGLHLVVTDTGDTSCEPVSYFTPKGILLSTIGISVMAAITYGFLWLMPPVRPFVHLIALGVFGVPMVIMVVSWVFFSRWEDLQPVFLVTKTAIESPAYSEAIAISDIRAVVSVSGYSRSGKWDDSRISIVQICVDLGTAEHPELVPLVGALQILPLFTRRVAVRLAGSIGRPYVDARLSKVHSDLGLFQQAEARFKWRHLTHRAPQELTRSASPAPRRP